MLLQKKASYEMTLRVKQTKTTLVRWAWPQEQKRLLMARDGQQQQAEGLVVHVEMVGQEEKW